VPKSVVVRLTAQRIMLNLGPDNTPVAPALTGGQSQEGSHGSPSRGGQAATVTRAAADLPLTTEPRLGHSDRLGDGKAPRLVGLLAAWLLFLSAGMGPIVGDTVGYLRAAASLLDGGLSNDGFHGYASGLLYVPAVILDRLTPLSLEAAVLIQSSIVMALGAWLLVPWFASTITGRPVRIVDRLAFTGILWALWGGYAPYALTDFPALFLFITAAVVAWRPGLRTPGVRSAFLAGALIGIAYNLRPAYIVALIGLAALLALQPHRVRAGALVLGVMLVLLPQAVVNVRYGESPLPPIPVGTGAAGSAHLAGGLRYQRTATSLDPAWPSRAIASCDPAGARLADGAGGTLTLTAYLGVLARDPVASMGLLSRHVVNGLWLDERGPVVHSVADRTFLYGVVNLVLVGLLIALAWSGTGLIALLLAVLACVPAVVAVVEPRDFMPLGVLAAAMFLPSFRWLRAAPLMTRTTVVLVCLGLVVMASGIATTTTALDIPRMWGDSATVCLAPAPG
jgi:hypothetical protein